MPDLLKSKILRHKSDWIWIILLGLLVQGVWAVRLDHPSYMDAYYYTNGGRTLAQGQGFTDWVVWQFLDGAEQIPTPSHTYWMPLPSILAAVGYWVVDDFRAAQLPFWLLAGLLPWLSFMISSGLSGERWQAWMAGLLTAWGGYYASYLSQPTTFAVYAWVGTLCLVCLGMGQGSWKFWLSAGIFAGLAHLTRADGLLFLAVGAGIVLLPQGVFPVGKGRSRFGGIVWLILGYLLVMAPWFARNILVMGKPLSSAGTQTIFLTNYDDLFAYNRTFNWQSYLAWGWQNIWRSKLEALWLAVQTFIAVSGMIFLSPLILVGWIRERANPLIRPLSWYTLLLGGVMVLLFTLPSGRGSLLHSSIAIWPWMMPLAAQGLGLILDWRGKNGNLIRIERDKRVYAGMSVIIGFIVSWITASGHPLRNEEGLILEEFGRNLPAGTVVMLPDSPMFYYHTGLPAINVPNESPEVLLELAEKFQATYLILDKDRPAPLNGVYTGEFVHPQIKLVWESAGIHLYQLQLSSNP